MQFTTESPRLAASWPSAAINGVINGAIAWGSFKGAPSIPLSMDSIGSPGITALGNAATVAFALTLIITCITFFVFRGAARKAEQSPAGLRAMPFVPTGLRLAVQNTLLVFGGFVAAAVLWQRVVGTVQAGPLTATLVVAGVAALATAIAEWRTRREMLAAAGARK